MPVSTSTASEKLRTILLSVATSVALSEGENEEIDVSAEEVVSSKKAKRTKSSASKKKKS